jgi:hypothetical protein
MIRRKLSRNLLALTAVFMATVAVAQEERGLLVNPDLSSGPVYFNSARFQSSLRSATDLGTLAQKNPAINEQAVTFGFAEKSAEAKFFIIGTLYTEALAYLQSDNLDEAAKRLAAIDRELINLQAPGALYNYLSQTRNLVERKQYSAEVLTDFLALFQPFFDDYARSRGDDKLTLFRTGTWLVDMSLAAAGQDTEGLKRPGQARYFSQVLQRLNAPKGVLDALERLTRITEKAELTDADMKEVLKLIKEIQTILA